MDKYEHISLVGEGSYGVVMKCRHKELNQMVAIKKFLETEEDATIRKMALREIRMLRRLKHENLVAIIEVFRYRKRFYLVFEYLDGTILDELENIDGGGGFDDTQCRERLYQITRAIAYCHANQIIHRDVKPENVLVSGSGVVKLCDFGFARLAPTRRVCAPLTDYVATRWYRAPELLTGSRDYGAAVDIWAIGCLFAEMMTGDALFAGESDVDQLFLITKMIGKPCERHLRLAWKNSRMRAALESASTSNAPSPLSKRFSDRSALHVDLLASCLRMDPDDRPTAEEMLAHSYFTHDDFPQTFLPNLRKKVLAEYRANPLLSDAASSIIAATDRFERAPRALAENQRSGYRYWRLHFDVEGAGGAVKRKTRDASVATPSTDGNDARCAAEKMSRFAFPSLPQCDYSDAKIDDRIAPKTSTSQITWSHLCAKTKNANVLLPDIANGKYQAAKKCERDLKAYVTMRKSPVLRWSKTKRKYNDLFEHVFER